MNANLMSRKDAAKAMGISECTLSRCVKLGAPVHRRGSTGHRYLVDVEAFVRWMEAQDRRKVKEKKEQKARQAAALTVEEMAARRREIVREILGK